MEMSFISEKEIVRFKDACKKLEESPSLFYLMNNKRWVMEELQKAVNYENAGTIG